jgi:hypothetical protein
MMNKMKNLAFTAMILTMAIGLNAQSFLTPYEGFSTKKTTYITMKDGSEIEGNFRNIKRKKGLIELVMIKVDGKVQKIPSDDIQHMYVPASGLGKMAVSLDQAFDAQQWESDDIEQERMKDGYAYFEFSEMIHKGKDYAVLLQLVNPGFANGIRVYHDPFAGETASAGIGGIKVAGGNEKSYYVKKGEDKAYRLKKKDYDDDFEKLFGDCEAVTSMVEDGDPRWSDFAKHAYAYLSCAK